MPTPIEHARAIARCDSPRSCLSRRISRIFLISSLAAGIASPSSRMGAACGDHGYRRAFTLTETAVQLPRIPCSTSRNPCSTSPKIGVQLPPDSVFNILRNTHTISPALRCARTDKAAAFCVRGVNSPLFSNIYMRRFLLGWKVLGYARRFEAENRQLRGRRRSARQGAGGRDAGGGRTTDEAFEVAHQRREDPLLPDIRDVDDVPRLPDWPQPPPGQAWSSRQPLARRPCSSGAPAVHPGICWG